MLAWMWVTSQEEVSRRTIDEKQHHLTMQGVGCLAIVTKEKLTAMKEHASSLTQTFRQTAHVTPVQLHELRPSVTGRQYTVFPLPPPAPGSWDESATTGLRREACLLVQGLSMYASGLMAIYLFARRSVKRWRSAAR